MWVWMLMTRMPALKAAGVDIRVLTGTTVADAARALPAKAQWPAHNYNHLMEQPTLLYTISLTLALTGWGNGLNAALAWGYVALRIAHSIVQATINRVAPRFALFTLSTLCLLALTVHAAIAVFHAHG